MKKFVVLLMAVAVVWLAMPSMAAAECDICGDANGDGEVDISDLVAMVDYLYNFIWPECPCGMEVDCDPVVKQQDIDYMVDYLFNGGPAPCDPDDDQVPDCDPCS